MKKRRLESGGGRHGMRNGTAGYISYSQNSDESELAIAHETTRESSLDRSSFRTERIKSSTKSRTYTPARYTSSTTILVTSPPGGCHTMHSGPSVYPKVNGTLVWESTISDKNTTSVTESV